MCMQRIYCTKLHRIIIISLDNCCMEKLINLFNDYSWIHQLDKLENL